MAKRKPRNRITTKAVQDTEAKPFTLPTVQVRPDNDEGPFDDDGLSVRQRQFVAALVGPAGGIASRAAEMAGYAAENRDALYATASRLLSSAKVQEAINRALLVKRMDPEWAKAGLTELAATSMANFLKFSEDGKWSVDLDKAAAAGALGQIRELREEVITGGDGPTAVIKRTIKLHDRRAALSDLLKLHGAIKDRHEIGITIDLKRLTEEELNKLREVMDAHERRRGFAGAAESGSN